MLKLYLAIMAIPKTIYFNFKYLRFNDAIRFPIIVSHRVSLVKTKGKLEIKAPIKTGMIRLGFGSVRIFDQIRMRTVWHVTGKVIFRGKASIGNGSKLSVLGELDMGNNFAISSHTQIECKNKIKFESNVLIGWDCLFMDGDAHNVFDVRGKKINHNKPIIISNNVWFGARCTILKGTHIANNVVVAANSCVMGKHDKSHCIIGGYPAKVIKENISWSI